MGGPNKEGNIDDQGKKEWVACGCEKARGLGCMITVGGIGLGQEWELLHVKAVAERRAQKPQEGCGGWWAAS